MHLNCVLHVVHVNGQLPQFHLQTPCVHVRMLACYHASIDRHTSGNVQVTRQLFQPYWTQWRADTQTLLAGLPGALARGSPGDDLLGLKLAFERWLLELKVCLPACQHRGPGLGTTPRCLGAWRLLVVVDGGIARAFDMQVHIVVDVSAGPAENAHVRLPVRRADATRGPGSWPGT